MEEEHLENSRRNIVSLLCRQIDCVALIQDGQLSIFLSAAEQNSDGREERRAGNASPLRQSTRAFNAFRFI